MQFWFLIVAAVAFMTPAVAAMIRENWSTEQGAQGPLVLASGLWLLAHKSRGLTAMPGRTGIAAAAMTLALLGVTFGRVTGTLWVDWAASYAALVVVLYALVGGAAIRRLWFPLTYLLFLVPIPYAIVGPLTHSRKLWLSGTAVDLLAWAGYDVAYGGTTLYIDQYELLIADACAGMNSLFSLIAIGSFYIYIRHRHHVRPAAILAAMLVPLAVFTNLMRVILLMLVTRHGGDALAQGPFHETIGMVMFAIMLASLVLVDAVTVRLLSRPGDA
jgi:exosortase